MNENQLKLVLAEHKEWLDTKGQQGKRADLRGADLEGANLRGANLKDADLRKSSLQLVSLIRASLQRTNLREANLREANLQGANLQGANLIGANLDGANLIGANLDGASLIGVNLGGANLIGANLDEANLLGVNLLGAYFDLEQFKYAINVSIPNLKEESLDKNTTDIYAQQISNADRQIQQLEQEKSEIEQQRNNEKEELQSENSAITKRLKKIEEELEAELAAKKQATSKQQLLEEMKRAIQPILAGINADKVIIERYKKQSLGLMGGGITCFLFVIIYLGWQLWPRGVANTEGTFHILQILSPGLVLALIGTGLLRHDWKIRQLTLKLIEQNNKIDIAMGLLQTSLNLSNIGSVKQTDGIPDLVKETFKEARTALLFKDATPQQASQNHSPIETKNIEENLLKKAIQSTTQQ